MDKQQFDEDNFNQDYYQQDYYDASQFVSDEEESQQYNPYGGFNPYGQYSQNGQYGKYDQYRNIQPEKNKSSFFKKFGKIMLEASIASAAFLALFGILVMGIGINENLSKVEVNEYKEDPYVEYREGLYSFTTNDVSVTFPCEFTDLQEKWEFKLNEDPNVYVINDDESQYFTMYREGENIGMICVYNDKGEPVTISQCMVEGVDFYVRNYSGEKVGEFEYLDGLNQDSTLEDFEEVLGDVDKETLYDVNWDTDEGWITVELNDEGDVKSVEVLVYRTIEGYND